MNITPLQACHIEPLTLALYQEWHDFAPWSSLEKIRAYYRKCLDGDGLPLAFAAVSEDGRLLGSAALKRFDMEEFPQYEYWLGDVFVLPEYRGKGIGHALIAHCLQTPAPYACPPLPLYARRTGGLRQIRLAGNRDAMAQRRNRLRDETGFTGRLKT